MKRISLCLLLLSVLLADVTGQNASKGLRILYIGDSITDGNWGGGGKPSDQRNHWDKNHLFGSGYMYLCAAEFMGHYPDKKFEFFNRGISGNTLADLQKRWKEDAIDINPDVLSILIGINDISMAMKENSPAKFDMKAWEENYRALLDQALSINPDIKFVLGEPFAVKAHQISDRFDERLELLKNCSTIIKRIAEDYQAVFLPYQDMFDKAIFSSDIEPVHWVWDGIHPTVAGHRLMADLWIEKTKHILLDYSLR